MDDIFESISFTVKCFYVFFSNGVGDLLEFLLYCPLFLVFISCLLYVFKKRNVQADNSYVRPIRAQVSGQERRQPATIRKDSSVVEWEELNEEKAKLILLYCCWIPLSFILSIMVSDAITVYLGVYMWLLGCVMVYKLEGDREVIADYTENFFLAFCWSTILLKGLYNLIASQTGLKVSRFLHMSVSSTSMPTLVQFLGQVQIWAYGGILVGYSIWMFNIYRQKKDNCYIPKREAELLRTSNNTGLFDESRYRY